MPFLKIAPKFGLTHNRLQKVLEKDLLLMFYNEY